MWSQDFKEFVGLLNAQGVEYLIVGGFAVIAHGHPRYTGDLDIWINATADNAAKMVGVLEAFGFGQLGLKAEDFSTPERVLQLGHPPFRIDILTAIDGVEFVDCYPKRLALNYEGQSVQFIGLDDLKRNKKAAGRFKDQDDLLNLAPDQAD